MVSIFSKGDDLSTSDVIDWLLHLNREFARINSDDSGVVADLSMTISDGTFSISDLSNKKYSHRDFENIWYRKGYLEFQEYPSVSYLNKTASNEINSFLKKERKAIREFLNYLISAANKYSINRFEDYQINKLIVLQEARNAGILIPDTLITTRKAQVSEFKKSHSSGIISKPLSNGLSITHKKKNFFGYTEEIDEQAINLMSDSFFPSLFQEKISKLFEIRAFYLDGDFYPMAIFSQESDKTMTDFRNYDYENPNRTVPFKLNADLENKLRTLMNKLNLTSGSTDLIFGKDHRAYFLEVNPNGQFGMVSDPCNYYIEKIIAQKLSV